jgi:hypothetical protein
MQKHADFRAVLQHAFRATEQGFCIMEDFHSLRKELHLRATSHTGSSSALPLNQAILGALNTAYATIFTFFKTSLFVRGYSQLPVCMKALGEVTANLACATIAVK